MFTCNHDLKGTLMNKTIVLTLLLCAYESSIYAGNKTGVPTFDLYEDMQSAKKEREKRAEKDASQPTFEIKPDQKNPLITTIQEVKPKAEEQPTGLRGLIHNYPITTQIVTMAVSFGAGYYAKDLWKALYDRLPDNAKEMLPEILRVVDRISLPATTATAETQTVITGTETPLFLDNYEQKEKQ